MRQQLHLCVRSVIAVVLLTNLVACGTTEPRAPASTVPTDDLSSAAVVALVENTPIHADDLTPSLFELAGREALREQVLDILLRQELARRGLSVSNDAVDRERSLFDERISSTGLKGDSGVMATEVYRARGLGPVRRQAMFWRNAALRLLTDDTVEVSDSDVDTAMELAYGPKVNARVIVTETERDAAEVLRLLGPSPSSSVFARLAERHSIDPTSSRGGLLQPIHLADSNYPVAVRELLGAASTGSLSSIIPLEDGAAILLKEGTSPASIPPAGARLRLKRELEVQLERGAMDAIARRLISEARVDVLDRSLGWSWDRQ
jgi:parvulin-like peptidyl-prolyl isomerase